MWRGRGPADNPGRSLDLGDARTRRQYRTGGRTDGLQLRKRPVAGLAALIIAAILGGGVAVVAALINYLSTTEPPFSEPGWALALLVIAIVATPIVARRSR
jgi:hypothetical protein